MPRHFARQGEQRQRLLQRYACRAHALRQAGALRLLAFAELDIGAETTVAQRDFEIRHRIGAEDAHARRALAALGRSLAIGGGDGEGARIAAFRIVRATDEGAELAELQRELAVAAGRAHPRIGTVDLLREDIVAEDAVERLQHVADAQVLGLADRGLEFVPERAQQRLPVDLGIGDAVEILFEIRGEVELDIALEEALQERRDQHALVLRHEALLLDADVFAVAQGRERRRIGRGPADAELFHALD